jgi:prepilin-type N-terminal cleavage/methylation domain-containing protein
MPLTRHKQSCSDRAAFTLVEIAVVATIIGILAAIAVPAFRRVKDRAIISTLENDLRIFSQEFIQYELNFGTYPQTQITPGLYPNGMEDRISKAWALPSVIGGTYRWVYDAGNGGGNNGNGGGNNGNGGGNNGNNGNGGGNNGNGGGNLSAYIEINGNSTETLRIDSSRLSEIDDDLDDGNTGSGNFQLSGLSIRYYLAQ